MARLREQDRARAAKAAVSECKEKPFKREYRQELQQLPSRILASGLGQTLAFYAAKTKDAEKKEIGEQLSRFLVNGKGTLDLLDHIVKMQDAGSYRRLTREALAYAEWLKRYSAALIPKE